MKNVPTLSPRRLALSAIGVSTLVAGAALAQDRGPRFGPDGDGGISEDAFVDGALRMMSFIDTDGDGDLSPGERASAQSFHEDEANRRFDSLDANGDGVLTREELAAAHEDRAERHDARFEEADTDGDGTVSQDEVIATARDRFAEADTDGDGILARDELRGLHPAGGPPHDCPHGARPGSR